VFMRIEWVLAAMKRMGNKNILQGLVEKNKKGDLPYRITQVFLVVWLSYFVRCCFPCLYFLSLLFLPPTPRHTPLMYTHHRKEKHSLRHSLKAGVVQLASSSTSSPWLRTLKSAFWLRGLQPLCGERSCAAALTHNSLTSGSDQLFLSYSSDLLLRARQ